MHQFRLNSACLFIIAIIIGEGTVFGSPIIPFDFWFGKVSRPDDDASIGPGLGGSPILVDTTNMNSLPIKSLSRSGIPGLIQTATPEELPLPVPSEDHFSSKRFTNNLFRLVSNYL